MKKENAYEDLPVLTREQMFEQIAQAALRDSRTAHHDAYQRSPEDLRPGEFIAVGVYRALSVLQNGVRGIPAFNLVPILPDNLDMNSYDTPIVSLQREDTKEKLSWDLGPEDFTQHGWSREPLVLKAVNEGDVSLVQVTQKVYDKVRNRLTISAKDLFHHIDDGY
jgi:hypothetical protein